MTCEYWQDQRQQIDSLSSNLYTSSYLRERLEIKSVELRELHKNMASWKEQTALALSSKFEEELDRKIKMYLRVLRSLSVYL